MMHVGLIAHLSNEILDHFCYIFFLIHVYGKSKSKYKTKVELI